MDLLMLDTPNDPSKLWSILVAMHLKDIGLFVESSQQTFLKILNTLKLTGQFALLLHTDTTVDLRINLWSDII